MKNIKIILTKYIWLVLAIFSFFLSGGDKPAEIAVWLGPFFLLRFYREVKLWKSIVFSLPLMVIISLIANKGMTPVSFNMLIRLTIINSIIALIPYICDRLLNRFLPKFAKTLLFPMLAVTAEAFLASPFKGATWGNPAYGINNLQLLQIVSVVGIWGLMFLIYWTASVINEFWEHRHHLRDIKKTITVFLAVLFIIYGFGLWRLHIEKPLENSVRVAGITSGPTYRAEMMGIFGKIFSARRTGVYDEESIRSSIGKKYQELLSESIKLAKSGVEIVAWAEGATFIFESDEKFFIQQAIESTREYNYYLGMSYMSINDNCQDLLSKNQPFVKNKLLLITPEGNVAWEYLKLHPAPGYEKMTTILGDGILKSSKTTKGIITGAICYDNDFPLYIRQAGKMRCDLLIDPSFDWAEVKNTHAKMARMRAIENGTSMLKPASSGISIAVDQYGNIISRVDDFKTNGDPLVCTLPMRSVKSLYTYLGDFMIWVSAFGGIILILISIINKFKQVH